MKGSGFTFFSCGRPVDHGVCDCGARAVGRCCFALRGRLAGKTCNRPKCARCSVDVGGRVHCPPHARLAGAEGVVR